MALIDKLIAAEAFIATVGKQHTELGGSGSSGEVERVRELDTRVAGSAREILILKDAAESLDVCGSTGIENRAGLMCSEQLSRLMHLDTETINGHRGVIDPY